MNRNRVSHIARKLMPPPEDFERYAEAYDKIDWSSWGDYEPQCTYSVTVNGKKTQKGAKKRESHVYQGKYKDQHEDRPRSGRQRWV